MVAGPRKTAQVQWEPANTAVDATAANSTRPSLALKPQTVAPSR